MALYYEDFVTVDLIAPAIHRDFLCRTIGEGDKLANRFGVIVQKNKQDIDLTGETCNGYFIRSDGGTVVINGTVSGNRAYVDIPQACYAYEGQFALAIKLSGDGAIGTMRIIDGTVSNTTTGTVIDPGTIIPSIESLLERIDEAVDSIPSDYNALCIELECEGRRTETKLAAGAYTEVGILTQAGTDTTYFNDWHTTPYIPLYCQDLYFKGGFFPVAAYNTFCLYDASLNVLYMAKGDTMVKASDYPTAKYFRASADLSDLNAYYVIIGNQRSFEYIAKTISTFTSPEPVKLPNDFYYEQGLLSSDGLSVDDSFTAAHNFNTTPYIEIPGENLYFSGGFFPSDAYNTFVLYNASKQVVAMGRGNQTISLADYPTAKYFRASSNYRDAGDFFVSISTMPANRGKEIHVGTGQAYTTLRAGIAEAIKYTGSKVYVHPGTYDFATEFADIISAQPSGLQGIYLDNNVHVFFMAGSYVKAVFNTSNSWINTYFNPFFGRNFVLEGLNIEAKNCRYCIHDEQSGENVQYHNVYKDCVMKMTADGTTGTYCQCIGGGLGKNGYIEVNGGKYESYGQDGSGESPAISYHNGGYEGMDSKLFFRDVYLDGDGGFFRFGYYGPSTKKSEVYVANCSMKAAILKRAENSSAVVDNFAITEWNNVIRT
jgi:hypothetical protein